MLTPLPTPQRQNLPLFLFLGFIICAATLLLFGMLAKNIIGTTSLVQLDQNVATTLHAWATEDATETFKFISLLGLQVLWVVVVVVALYYALTKHWAHLVIWLVAVAGAQVLNAVVVYGMLAFFILLQVRNPAVRTGVILFTIVLVLLIGASRIYLGVHYFSDVAAGYAAGVIWLTICINAMNVLVARRQWRAAKSPSNES